MSALSATIDAGVPLDLNQIIQPDDPAKATALLEYWKTVLGGFVTVCVAVWGFATKQGRAMFGLLAVALPFRIVLKRQPNVAVVPDPLQCQWSVGKYPNGRKVTHILYRGNVTNGNKEGDLLLLRCHVLRPHIEGRVMVRHPERNIYGNEYPVRARTVVPMDAHFTTETLLLKSPKELVLDLVFIDHNGAAIRVRDVRFRCAARPEDLTTAPPPVKGPENA